MSGHSKWSKVKHQKAVTDTVKARFFTKASHAITIAVREGGGVTDPIGNFKLRLAIENARAVNMPKENIDRAIERAGGLGGRGIETILYEGFGPKGVAILIEAVTDNRQRTVSVIRNILEKHEGHLGPPGSVHYIFDSVGILVVSKEGIVYDTLLEVAINAGARDCIEEADGYVLFTEVSSLFSVKSALEEKGVMAAHADVVYQPKTTMPLEGHEKAILERLVGTLEDSDDVQRVFTNVEE
ncbi:MAG: YebC/PmpR family DNA-binding transcriptional regulator [Candidatus Gottesmanbacteria bacterium]|nr:YebC/PmpR family DNA-binding transcriptional regulator [Candidatus Gottesmanbacteria bacterium]